MRGKIKLNLSGDNFHNGVSISGYITYVKQHIIGISWAHLALSQNGLQGLVSGPLRKYVVVATIPQDTGGIDLNAVDKNLQTKNGDGEIKFNVDPAMLEKFRNTPGFVPVIINIQPLADLPAFLGVSH